MEKDLNKIQVHTTTGWMSAARYLETVPDKERQNVTKGIYECLRLDWPMSILNILHLTRQIKRRKLD